jgi:hypothetical protein
MIGEQHYYEAKVFLSHYRDALATLEYLLSHAAKSHKIEPPLPESKPYKITSSRAPNAERYHYQSR